MKQYLKNTMCRVCDSTKIFYWDDTHTITICEICGYIESVPVPCAVCGDPACICEDDGNWAAHCMTCENSTGKKGEYDPIHGSRNMAVLAWNLMNFELLKNKI